MDRSQQSASHLDCRTAGSDRNRYDLQNLARRPRDHAITVRHELDLLHRKMRQPWHDIILVKSHLIRRLKRLISVPDTDEHLLPP
jgi:hypothetical protein